MIFESHAHYDDEAFDKDRDKVLEECRSCGIGFIVNVSSDLKSVSSTLELARKWDFISAAVGIHPDSVGELDENSFRWLEERCRDAETVAVGEIGLDYHWDKENHDLQKYWFQRQMDLAKDMGLPVIVHSRDAAADTMEEIRKAWSEGRKGVIHCFSYSVEMAKEYVEMGFYIGIGGVVTFKNARKLKEVVKAVPLESILLETDCPYLAPEPNRGKRNSSLNLTYVAETVAELKGTTSEAVTEITCKNAEKMYFGNLRE